MNPVYICFLTKEVFSHIVSDIEYIGATTFVDVDSGLNPKKNDIIIFVGTDYRYYNEYRFICTRIKDLCFDDTPANVYILNSLYDLSYISEDFMAFIKIMEYSNHYINASSG